MYSFGDVTVRITRGSKQACHHRRMFVHNYIPWQHLSDSTGKSVIHYGAFYKHHSHARYVQLDC